MNMHQSVLTGSIQTGKEEQQAPCAPDTKLYKYRIYIKVDNDIIPASKTSILPPHVELYTKKDESNDFIEKIARMANLVNDIIYIVSPGTCIGSD
ncbi:hypothetical protein PR048_028317 [Dryococelus australis]|uniref:Uncharacterized protein n=1 Tax=Dryococelus australis TaxID=614101 RepID=A0ABQ9GJ01_9NEOP|nr:hypothetical protein PR048_028317 [Dryococelus australis]